jgi:hypothetical protein
MACAAQEIRDYTKKTASNVVGVNVNGWYREESWKAVGLGRD